MKSDIAAERFDFHVKSHSARDLWPPARCLNRKSRSFIITFNRELTCFGHLHLTFGHSRLLELIYTHLFSQISANMMKAVAILFLAVSALSQTVVAANFTATDIAVMQFAFNLGE